MWKRLLDNAPLAMKAQSKFMFGLPVNARRKPALELLAKLLADQRGDVTVHTLDLDLLLADKASPGTLGTERVGTHLLRDPGTVAGMPALGYRPGTRHRRDFLPCKR
jgi:hypothetical protein